MLLNLTSLLGRVALLERIEVSAERMRTLKKVSMPRENKKDKSGGESWKVIH
jgi:hypothetical protein